MEKKSRRRFSTDEKMGIVNRLKDGEKTKVLCREIGISASMLSLWKKQMSKRRYAAKDSVVTVNDELVENIKDQLNDLTSMPLTKDRSEDLRTEMQLLRQQSDRLASSLKAVLNRHPEAIDIFIRESIRG
jgi:transposase-like protein